VTSSDDFDDVSGDSDEDINSLEDNPADRNSGDVIVESGANLAFLAPDTPIYRLRLSYSNETFSAIYDGGLLCCRTLVVVSTRYGKDLAQVIGPVQRKGSRVISEIARIERLTSREDLEKLEYNKKLEEEAFDICKVKIREHKLDMKLVSVHCLLEDPKILFFFTSENRVDFRDLVKDMASIFKLRIELRQIGVRDEARVMGGLGICGNLYCCHAISDKLKPVSIKMAKEQNLSLNSMKISGTCGRLLCCLAYEHNFYSEQRKLIPQEGVKFNYDGTVWKIIEVNVVTGAVRTASEDGRQLHLSVSQFERTDGRWRIRAKAFKNGAE
jgi:cell fate regulator YaaT (PSP1 superfamily)